MPSRARPSSRRVAQGPQSRPARWVAGATRVTAAPDRRGAREVRRRAGEEAGAEAEPEASTSKEEEPKITAGGLAELIGFGLGLPVPASVELDKENWKVGSGGATGAAAAAAGPAPVPACCRRGGGLGD